MNAILLNRRKKMNVKISVLLILLTLGHYAMDTVYLFNLHFQQWSVVNLHCGRISD